MTLGKCGKFSMEIQQMSTTMWLRCRNKKTDIKVTITSVEATILKLIEIFLADKYKNKPSENFRMQMKYVILKTIGGHQK